MEVMNCLTVCGGAENFEVNFCQFAQKETDFFPVILYESSGFPLYKKLISFSNKAPFVVGKRNSIDIRAIKRLRRYIRDNKIDVIHTENNCLITTFFASVSSKTPIVHTIHLPPNKETSSWLAKLLYKFIYRSKRVTPVTLTEENSVNFSNTYHFPKKIFCIKNGVNSEEFFSDIPLEKRSIDCAVLARMSEPKNYPQILNIMCEVHRINPQLKFAIYGEGDLEDFVLDFAKQHDMYSYVSINKPTSKPQEVLKNAKTLLLPSLFEASPMVIMEAMSAGCVCIASHVGGIPDLISSDVDGFTFAPEDVKSFSSKIVEICSFGEKFNDLSKAAETKARNCFSLKRTWDEYYSLFQTNLKR